LSPWFPSFLNSLYRNIIVDANPRLPALSLPGGIPTRGSAASACRSTGRAYSATALATGLATKALLSGLIGSPVAAKSDRRCPGRLLARSRRTGLLRAAAANMWSNRCRLLTAAWSRDCRPLTDLWSRYDRPSTDTWSEWCRLLINNATAFPAAIAVCVGVPSVAVCPSGGPGLYRSAPPGFTQSCIPVGVRTTGS
jgi:hypothetical protein